MILEAWEAQNLQGRLADPGTQRQVAVQVQRWPAGRIPSCLLRSTFVLKLRSSTDWTRLTHIILYSISTALNVDLIQKASAQTHPESYLTAYLGTVTQPSWHIKLTIIAPVAYWSFVSSLFLSILQFYWFLKELLFFVCLFHWFLPLFSCFLFHWFLLLALFPSYCWV